jgi:hypothetical protein
MSKKLTKVPNATVSKKQAELIAGPYSEFVILNTKGQVIEAGWAQVKRLKARSLPEGCKLKLSRGD